MESESNLVQQAQKGSKEAFRELLRMHQGRIRSYLSRFVRDREMVDDLAQETFLAAYRSLATYPREIALGLWLLGIAKHRALNYLREEALRRSHEREKVIPILVEAQLHRLDSGEAELARHEDRLLALRSCIEELPPESALLIRNRYFQNQRVMDIAGKTGREKSAVGVALLRLRQALRLCMESKVAAWEGPS